MRTINIRFAAFAATALFAANSFAAIPDSEITYFPFSGWSHATIAAGGQTFNNVFGDVDVTVTAIGTHPYSSVATANGILTGRLDQMGSHSFRFVFSEPLELVLESQTVDGQEVFSVFSTGTEAYMHQFGAAPTVSFPSGGIAITGNGYGVNPTGASRGQFTMTTDRLTVSYRSLVSSPLKWERFRLGAVTIPEPNTFALAGLAGLGLILGSRKRNK